MEADLKLIQECGFNSFEEVVKKITEMVDVMRAGRLRAEKNLERFTEEAKRLLKEGQKDKAKKEILKKKKYTEKVKTIDTQLNKILEKLNTVKNSTQMLQVLSATKYCNNLILGELTQKDAPEGNNENQDLIDNDKEITKYIEVLTKSKKKKANPAPDKVEQKVDNLEEDEKFPQPEDNDFPQDNNAENDNVPKQMEKKNININANINNYGVNQNQGNNNNINVKQVKNPYLNNKDNYNNNPNNNNFNNNNYNNNNNNFNNNNYSFNNIPKQKNPYDDIF